MPERILRIGVDIDDALFQSAHRSIELYNKAHGTDLSLEDWYDFSDKATWATKWKSDDMSVLVNRVVGDMAGDAFNQGVLPIEGAKEQLHHLQSRGHQLFAVTGRSEAIRTQTLALLDTQYHGVFHKDTLFCVDHFEHDGRRASKADVALDLELTHFVEDLPAHANELARVGIATLLFDPGYPWNQKGVDKAVIRMPSWQEIGAFLDAEASR